jgi:hypothetical protein
MLETELCLNLGGMTFGEVGLVESRDKCDV